MKKSVLFAGMAAFMMCLASCGGKKAEAPATDAEEIAAEAAAPALSLIHISEPTRH